MTAPLLACMALVAQAYALPPRVLPAIQAAEDVRDRLLTRPCFNVAAAGLILRTYLDETRGNLLRAIGDYHSHTPVLNLRYQARVLRSAAALFRPDAPDVRRNTRYLTVGRSGPYGSRSQGCRHCGPAPEEYRGYTWRHGYFP
jgi:hypothetical protein